MTYLIDVRGFRKLTVLFAEFLKKSVGMVLFTQHSLEKAITS